MQQQQPFLPPCVRRFVAAAELEAERLHAVVDELPPDYWPPWLYLPGGAAWTRLVFHREAPGLMSTRPPTGGAPTEASL